MENKIKAKAIQATDLRIGNWVTAGKDTIQVIELDDERINYCARLETLSGIPLTPEILLKCGAIPKNANYYNIGRYLFSVNTIGIVRFHVSGKVVYLDYLHQLQNLLHSLTNKELEIKL